MVWQRVARCTAVCTQLFHAMGLQKQNSISNFIRKPFKKKKKKSKSKHIPADGEVVAVNGACSSAAGGGEGSALLESRVSQLSAELRELRTEMAALKGGFTSLQAQMARGRHRRDSYESCWDAGSLRFYAAHEVMSPAALESPIF